MSWVSFVSSVLKRKNIMVLCYGVVFFWDVIFWILDDENENFWDWSVGLFYYLLMYLFSFFLIFVFILNKGKLES